MPTKEQIQANRQAHIDYLRETRYNEDFEESSSLLADQAWDDFDALANDPYDFDF